MLHVYIKATYKIVGQFYLQQLQKLQGQKADTS